MRPAAHRACISRLSHPPLEAVLGSWDGVLPGPRRLPGPARAGKASTAGRRPGPGPRPGNGPSATPSPRTGRGPRRAEPSGRRASDNYLAQGRLRRPTAPDLRRPAGTARPRRASDTYLARGAGAWPLPDAPRAAPHAPPRAAPAHPQTGEFSNGDARVGAAGP
jgi:hypothetical protein